MGSVRVPLLVLALVAAALGGAALAAEEKTEAKTKAKRVCINTREINSISALDDGHAFVKLSAGRYYMFTLDKACQGFKLARRIAISEARRVCNDGLTLLSFEYPAVGPMRCRIDVIDSVPDKEAAWELIESRAGPQ